MVSKHVGEGLDVHPVLKGKSESSQTVSLEEFLTGRLRHRYDVNALAIHARSRVAG
jgi:hypothetical protein